MKDTTSGTIEEVIEQLATNRDRIAELTDHVPADQLRTPPAHGEWSPVEVLAHLRACADVWGSAIATIAEGQQNSIRAINPRAWIKRTDYRDLPFEESFRAFSDQRAALLEQLRALPPEAWIPMVTITGAGRPLQRSVMSYAAWLANHERTHVAQLSRMLGSASDRVPE